jgi:ABC-type glycerol-3-phosphate transport system permease component
MMAGARRRAGAWRAAAVGAIGLVLNAPVLLMLLNSWQTTDTMLASRSVLPRVLTAANYVFLLRHTPFVAFLLNSALVAVASTALTIVGAALAGYALSRWRGALLEGYARALLMVQMFPIIMALIPLFVIFRVLGLINSPLSVVIVYGAVHLPFATWMFRAFFDGIPQSLDEAALVDGCSRLAAFRRVVLPLAGPGTAAVTVFSFLASYNEFFIASVFLRDESVMTVPAGVQMFMQQYATDWGSLMAAATMAMLPAFAFFLFVQKYAVAGGIEGAVKG